MWIRVTCILAWFGCIVIFMLVSLWRFRKASSQSLQHVAYDDTYPSDSDS